jgi:hypothetical protein
MEAVLDVGGGEGGAHGVRGVAMDVADGGVLLSFSNCVQIQTGVGDVFYGVEYSVPCFFV